MGYVHTFEVNENMVDKGEIEVNVYDYNGVPVKGAKVYISYVGNEENPIGDSTTDEDGSAVFASLSTPPLEYSMEPGIRQPFAEYDIYVRAEGYEDVNITGSDLFSGQISIQNVYMRRIGNAQELDNIVIPVNTLYGDYPAKIEENDIKNISETGEIVLNKVVIPEFIIVHDGSPTDNTAKNYYVPYKDYIKNVASSEIYSTWPKQTIEANVLAILSFTLNRVYTEWYRNKGYDFTITSSTAYDQKWIYGRNIFESISLVVDDIFDSYISKPNVRQPILTQYCDGKKILCPNRLSQWGSKYLGDQNYSSVEILRYYYGGDVYVNTAEEIAGVPKSFPGVNLDIGSSGENVRIIQNQLNLIGNYFPKIPRLIEDGKYGENTANTVRIFQEVFGLTPTGIVDFATWYRISDKYVALSKLAEL